MRGKTRPTGSRTAVRLTLREGAAVTVRGGERAACSWAGGRGIVSLSLVGTWRSQRSLAEPHSPAPSFRTLRGVSYVCSAQDNFVQQGHLCPWGARSPPYGLLKRNDDRDAGRHTPSRNGDPQALTVFPPDFIVSRLHLCSPEKQRDRAQHQTRRHFKTTTFVPFGGAAVSGSRFPG